MSKDTGSRLNPPRWPDILLKAEEALPLVDGASATRILEAVLRAIIVAHPRDEAGTVDGRLRRAMDALFGREPTNGRPSEDRTALLLLMADMRVADELDVENWDFQKRLGKVKRGRPRPRGAERLAHLAAEQLRVEYTENLIASLAAEFGAREQELRDLRLAQKAFGNVEAKVASFLLDVLKDSDLTFNSRAIDEVTFGPWEELVE